MINLKIRYLKPSLLALLLLTAWSAYAQLKLTKDLSNTSQNVGESTLLDSTPARLNKAARTPDNALREVDYIVAVVNSEPITRNEVLAKQARAYAQWAAQGVRPPSESEVFKRVLERLIEERAALQLAKETGIRINNDTLNDALLGVARQHQLTTVPALQNKYEREGGNWASYREEIRNELTLIQLREREVESRVRISEAEIDQALRDQNTLQKEIPDIHLAQILIALPENATEVQIGSAMQKAREIKALAASGADFAKLALQYSDASDKEKGGSMGLRSADRYPSLFSEAVQTLKVGAISEPLRSGAGVHILKVIERQQNRVATTTQAKVRHILLPISVQLSEEQAKMRIKSFKDQIELKQATFSELAKKHSTDGSALQGGDLGFSKPGYFVPEFERVVNALAIGELSDPVVTRFGVHLIEVLERKEVVVTEREQRQQVSDLLREKKAFEAYALWIAEMRNRAYVEFRNSGATP